MSKKQHAPARWRKIQNPFRFPTDDGRWWWALNEVRVDEARMVGDTAVNEVSARAAVLAALAMPGSGA